MARVPLLSGITADETAEFKMSRPVNLEVVPVDNKIAKAQFRMTAGALPFATGPGVDRGGILWSGIMHRVMGTKLVTVDAAGVVTQLGDVGGTGQVAFDYSFDRLGIRSGDKLYYWNGAALTLVADIDLGPVLDVMWIDGYFMTTDGTSVIVTELNDPTSVLPLKYGSAEEDPDPVTGLIKVRNEPYILGRHTIQVLRNVGGNGFPFAVVRGATIPLGCVSPTAKCRFADSFAFVGGAKGEALGVYIAGDGNAAKISDRAIDDELAAVEDPTSIILENRSWRGERRLLVHLPDKTLVFQANATRDLEEPVWPSVQSGRGNPYRLRNAVLAYGRTFVGDTESAAIGELSETVSTHFGEAAEWKFDVGLIYNEAKGFILSKVELVGLPGRAPHGEDGRIFMSMTRDGETFSVERAIPTGKAGQRALRLQWRPRTNFRLWAGLRFRGYSAALPGIAACEVEATPLAA
jgi:hypothetical protein